MWFIFQLALLLPVIITAIPTNVGKAASASFSASFEDSGSKPLLSFDNGGVGVNFLGYHASAGLGGLLTGNTADGGLHAEAGTPFGQRAGAGLGGTVNGGDGAIGYKYHYADKGVDPLSLLGLISRGRRPVVITTKKPKQSSEVESLE